MAGNAAEIICRTALCISGDSLRQSLTSFRSSSVSSFSRKSLLKNSATVIPNAWQHRSIVETVGLFPRFIMLEIVDCEIFASFASYYFDHPRSSRSSVIRAIKSISFTTSPHFNFIRKVRISVRANRLDIITMLLRSVPYRVWRYRCTLTVAKAKGDNQKPLLLRFKSKNDNYHSSGFTEANSIAFFILSSNISVGMSAMPSCSSLRTISL